MGLLTAAIVTTTAALVSTTFTQQQAQNNAVQAYVDQMTTLFTNSSLSESPEEANKVRGLARARTLLVLEQTDSSHKSLVIQFLHDAHLIQGEEPAISLDNADLSNTDLSNADLSEATLRDANFSNSDLSGADLSRADLSGAKGVTSDELKRQANSLNGATMPNGQKYEN
jgi:uncharacterized protein YjbI with pentapeptide repeats